jgi:hypothetical protein
LVIGGRGNYAEDSLRGDFQRRRRTAISSAWRCCSFPGTIRPVIDRVFPFESAKDAMAYAERERARGKVVATMADLPPAHPVMARLRGAASASIRSPSLDPAADHDQRDRARNRADWVMKSGSGNDLDGENHGDEPVDGGAERRPPPCPGDVVAALLPEVLETVACVAQDQEPGRSGDGRCGEQDEGAGDAALHGDYPGSSVCHCEPDVDRCDQG